TRGQHADVFGVGHKVGSRSGARAARHGRGASDI
ncbi:hypothetical protein EVAR_101650_1, partial [Eumeta japonica]